MVRVQRLTGSIVHLDESRLSVAAREFITEHPYHRCFHECKYGSRCRDHRHNAKGCSFIHFPENHDPSQDSAAELARRRRHHHHHQDPRNQETPRRLVLSDNIHASFPALASTFSTNANHVDNNNKKEPTPEVASKDEVKEFKPDFVFVCRALTKKNELIHIDRIDSRTVGGSKLKLNHSDHLRERRFGSRSSAIISHRSEFGDYMRPRDECPASARNEECVLRSCTMIHILPDPEEKKKKEQEQQQEDEKVKKANENQEQQNGSAAAVASADNNNKITSSRSNNKIAPASHDCVYCCEDLSHIRPLPIPNNNNNNNSTSSSSTSGQTPNSNDDDEEVKNCDNDNNGTTNLITVYQQKFVCSRGHSMCAACFTRNVSEIWAPRATSVKLEGNNNKKNNDDTTSPEDGASNDDVSPPSHEVPQLYCCEQDCDSAPITAYEVATVVTDPKAFEAFNEAQQRARDAIAFHNANTRVQQVLQAKSKEEAEQAARKLADESLSKALDRSKTFMCPKCNCLVELENCNDLRAHHHQVLDQDHDDEAHQFMALAMNGLPGIREFERLQRERREQNRNNAADNKKKKPVGVINNSCPRCGFYAEDISHWKKWDGIVRSDEETLKIPRKANEVEDRRHEINSRYFHRGDEEEERPFYHQQMRQFVPQFTPQFMTTPGEHRQVAYHYTPYNTNRYGRAAISQPDSDEEEQEYHIQTPTTTLTAARERFQQQQQQQAEIHRREREAIEAARGYFNSRQQQPRQNEEEEDQTQRDHRMAMEMFVELNEDVVSIPAREQQQQRQQQERAREQMQWVREHLALENQRMLRAREQAERQQQCMESERLDRDAVVPWVRRPRNLISEHPNSDQANNSHNNTNDTTTRVRVHNPYPWISSQQQPNQNRGDNGVETNGNNNSTTATVESSSSNNSLFGGRGRGAMMRGRGRGGGDNNAN